MGGIMGRGCSTWFCIILAVLLLGGIPCESNGETWVTLGTTQDESEIFLDQDSIRNPSGDIIIATIKRVFSSQHRQKIVDDAKSSGIIEPYLTRFGYHKMAYSKYFYEIDCKEKKNRLESMVVYDQMGNNITSTKGTGSWDYIHANTFLESIQAKYCPAKKVELDNILWILYSEDKDAKHYYDRDNITKSEKHRITVSSKELLISDDYQSGYAMILFNDLNTKSKIIETRRLWEIDCETRKARVLRFTVYDDKRSIVYTNSHSTDWHDIKEEVTTGLSRELCPSKESETKKKAKKK
jgi:hypothetical protein